MKAIKEPVYLFTAIGLVLFIGLVTCNLTKREPKTQVDLVTEIPTEPITEYQEPLEVDPYPVTKNVDPVEVERIKLIGRLVKGIIKANTYEGELVWYECGKRYTEEEVHAEALNWAFIIEKGSSLYKVNPWGIMGTIYNESKFDRCSLGKFPKLHAEKLGFLKKNKRFQSRNKEDILAYLNSKECKSYFHRDNIDLGAMQVLSMFIDLPPEKQLTLDPGLLHQIAEMASREAYPGCKGRPWACWRGSHKDWYDAKVTRYARRMGAGVDEI